MSLANKNLLCLFATFVVFSFPRAVYATPADDDPHCTTYEDMNKFSDQRALGMCSGQIFEAKDAEMNKLYKEQMHRLGSKDNRSRLRDAQRTWISFRDKACLYEVGPNNGTGTEYGMDLGLCKAKLTDQRIENLKSYLACTDNGCPN